MVFASQIAAISGGNSYLIIIKQNELDELRSDLGVEKTPAILAYDSQGLGRRHDARRKLRIHRIQGVVIPIDDRQNPNPVGYLLPLQTVRETLTIVAFVMMPYER